MAENEINGIFDTKRKAMSAFGKACAGKYIVLHYKKIEYYDRYPAEPYSSSVISYARRQYVDGNTRQSDPYVASENCYELFRVGPRGGLKRLKLRTGQRPKNIAVINEGHPENISAVLQTDGGWAVAPSFAGAVTDEIPQCFIGVSGK